MAIAGRLASAVGYLWLADLPVLSADRGPRDLPFENFAGSAFYSVALVFLGRALRKRARPVRRRGQRSRGPFRCRPRRSSPTPPGHNPRRGSAPCPPSAPKAPAASWTSRRSPARPWIRDSPPTIGPPPGDGTQDLPPADRRSTGEMGEKAALEAGGGQRSGPRGSRRRSPASCSTTPASRESRPRLSASASADLNITWLALSPLISLSSIRYMRARSRHALRNAFSLKSPGSLQLVTDDLIGIEKWKHRPLGDRWAHLGEDLTRPVGHETAISGTSSSMSAETHPGTPPSPGRRTRT